MCSEEKGLELKRVRGSTGHQNIRGEGGGGTGKWGWERRDGLGKEGRQDEGGEVGKKCGARKG